MTTNKSGNVQETCSRFTIAEITLLEEGGRRSMMTTNKSGNVQETCSRFTIAEIALLEEGGAGLDRYTNAWSN